MTSLHRVYAFYSRLGHEISPDNAFVMTHMQFWRLLKDCHLHYEDYGLVDMDRWLGASCTSLIYVPCYSALILVLQIFQSHVNCCNFCDHSVAHHCVHCCKGDAASQWEMAILGCQKSVTPEPID